jgi:hypothetical protein
VLRYAAAAAVATAQKPENGGEASSDATAAPALQTTETLAQVLSAGVAKTKAQPQPVLQPAQAPPVDVLPSAPSTNDEVSNTNVVAVTTPKAHVYPPVNTDLLKDNVPESLSDLFASYQKARTKGIII